MLRAEAEAKQQVKSTIPGYESPAIEAARRAMASATISSSASSSQASSSKSTSDGDWRRKPAAISSNGGSNGAWRRGTNTVGSSSSTDVSASNDTWRSRTKHTNTEEEVPDDWEQEEENKAASKPVEKEGEINSTAIDDAKASISVVTPLSEEEEAKKARSLGKKIRAAQSLQERQQKAGEKLQPEQQAKVDALEDMIRDLNTLGVSDDGDKAAA